VVGQDFETRPATLPGYEIRRVKNAVYPGIIRLAPYSQPSTLNSQPSSVPGLLYHNLDPESLARLDRFEGEDYRRLEVEVTTNEGHPLTAETYVIPPEHGHLLTDDFWTAQQFADRGDLERFVAKYGGFQRLE
jgi:gamma-glutamylcyclotransferase (GGCT)/AIG2-like uncharacterized protein YtfP